MYMYDFELLGRNENGLRNEMETVQTIIKAINMKFGLEKCARICSKIAGVQNKMNVGTHLRTTLKNWTREKHISI